MRMFVTRVVPDVRSDMACSIELRVPFSTMIYARTERVEEHSSRGGGAGGARGLRSGRKPSPSSGLRAQPNVVNLRESRVHVILEIIVYRSITHGFGRKSSSEYES